MKCHRLIITGRVQGVGFRPYIFREATKCGLKGSIKNTSQGVEIMVDDLVAMQKILKDLPPLAKVTSQKVEPGEGDEKLNKFFIQKSNKDTPTGADLPPDTAPCAECFAELKNDSERRCGYPFLSCTNCGPRYSVAKQLPFDREHTTLKNFPLCADCQAEYDNSTDRRCHAQTMACPACGPQLKFYLEGKKLDVDPLPHTIAQLRQNQIVAVKGVGGFGLLGRATPEVTAQLRKALHRPHKPLALLVKDLDMAEALCQLDDLERAQLEQPQRPIVLCRKHNQADDHISTNNCLGLMLPPSPLHHLIAQKFDEPLILTSANLPGIPIPTRREAVEWLTVLDYNRAITHASDDSILKVVANTPLLIRRSRGYVPDPLPIPKKLQTDHREILAIGGDLKNTFALKQGNQIRLSPHLGDLAGLESQARWQQTLADWLQFYGAEPQVLLLDAHPGFALRDWAHSFAKRHQIKVFEVQHHHAHAAAVTLEHELDDHYAIVGDGLGWGEDNTIWGGEVFAVNNKQLAINNERFERIGHLEPHQLVGGDLANQQPVRYLLDALRSVISLEQIQAVLPQFKPNELQLIHQQAEAHFNSIASSSLGRTLDAVAILLRLGTHNRFEGDLAQQLEACAEASTPLTKGDLGGFLDPLFKKDGELTVLRTTPLFQYLLNHRDHDPAPILARTALHYLAEGLWQITIQHQTQNQLEVLPRTWSGGCAYNTIMSNYFVQKDVYLNQAIPPGDGGLAAGQIAYFLKNH